MVNVVAEMLLTDPAPAAIWAVLMVLAMPALMLLASPQAVRDPRRAMLEMVASVRGLRERRARRHSEAAQLVRYADELSVAAQRAVQAAQRWHEHWQHTAQQTESAWQAWHDAERELARLRAGAVFAAPVARTAAQYADRERFLHRAVRAAVQRGDLPACAWADVEAGRGWDPRLHPVEQELVVQRVVVAHRLAAYRQAADAERTAWHDSQLAVATRDSLRQETVTAAAQAAAVRHLAPVHRPQTAGRRLVLAPRLNL